MISGIRLCWHNKPEHVSCSAGWGWAVNRELLAQNKADDEFTVLFLITQDLQASLKPSIKPTPTHGRKDPRPSLLCGWAAVTSEDCWLEIFFWGFSHSWEFRSFYPLLLVLLWTLKCHLVQVLVYGHSAFQGNLANLAFSAQSVRNTHKPTNLRSPSMGNVLRNFPGLVVYGALETK